MENNNALKVSVRCLFRKFNLKFYRTNYKAILYMSQNYNSLSQSMLSLRKCPLSYIQILYK